MRAANHEYAELWNRVQDRQAQRRKSSDCERALEIIQRQRDEDYVRRISDPDALLRMYGDRDTRICKLYDAEKPGVILRAPSEPDDTDERSFVLGIITALLAVGTVLIVVSAAVALLML